MYDVSGERALIRFSKGSVTLKTLRIIIVNAKWHDHKEDSLHSYFLVDCYVPTIELAGIRCRLLRTKTLIVLFSTLFLVSKIVPDK